MSALRSLLSDDGETAARGTGWFGVADRLDWSATASAGLRAMS
jgi:hypothetical protein